MFFAMTIRLHPFTKTISEKHAGAVTLKSWSREFLRGALSEKYPDTAKGILLKNSI
jgi:uncharacterized protein YqkB